MKCNKTSKLSKNEYGLVSIMVTMIIMLVISLIVIGFARLVRREQRQALDRQLSTQAFYAAESGINEAVRLFREAQEAGRTASELRKDDCGPSALYPTTNVIDAAANVSFTCLLVEPAPLSLDYSNVGTDEATVFPIEADGGGRVGRLDISWQDTTEGVPDFSGCPADKQFPPAGGAGGWPANCSAGMMKIELVPIRSTIRRSELMNDSMVIYMQPRSGPASPSVVSFTSSDTKGAVYPVNCNSSATPKTCNLTISNLNGNPSYYMRIRSIYKSSSVNIVGYNPSGSRIRLIGAQALIDSTGKANDVLRRVVVRIPMSSTGLGTPDFALFSADTLCKRFDTAPNIFRDACSDTIDDITDVSSDRFPSYATSCRPPFCTPTPRPPSTTPRPGPNPRASNHWRRTLYNTSPGSAPTCTWNWGDGTVTRNQACVPGERLSHQYPEPSDKTVAWACTRYTVTLTMNYTDIGPRQYSSRITVPTYQIDGSRC